MKRNPKSYIRLLHASPDAPAVDVYLNDELVVENLSYRDFTPYWPVDPGSYTALVYPAGTTMNSVFSGQLTIPEEPTILTIAAINPVSSLDLYPIEDPVESLPSGQVGVRFVHLSPNAPNVDLVLPNGTPLFEDVEYKEVTNYLNLQPGEYAVNVVPTGSNQPVLYVPNIQLRPDRFYSIYAVGLVGEEPNLQVLIPLDGNSYITL